MCYKDPGPRCSTDARAEVIKWKQEFQKAKAAGDVKGALHARKMHQFAQADYNLTPEGIERLTLGLVRQGGMLDDTLAKEHYTSLQTIARIDNTVRDWQKKNPGQTLPKELKKARQDARKNHKIVAQETMAAFHDRIAAQINANPEKYGATDRVQGKQISVQNIAHMEAAIDMFRVMRRNGELRQPEEALASIGRLATSVAERRWRLAMLGDDFHLNDTTDQHNPQSPDRAEYVRRMLDPDRARVTTFGDMHGDKKKAKAYAKGTTESQEAAAAMSEDSEPEHEDTPDVMSPAQMQAVEEHFSVGSSGMSDIAHAMRSGSIHGRAI